MRRFRSTLRLASRKTISTPGNKFSYLSHQSHLVENRQASPPPEVRAIRDRLNLDYGKIDFSCPDGEVIVYDANKCVGTRQDPGEPVMKIAAALSDGIDAWIGSRPPS